MVLVSQDEYKMLPFEAVELVILHKLGKGVEIRACQPGTSDTAGGSWLGNYRDVDEGKHVIRDVATCYSCGEKIYMMPPSLGGKK